MKKILICLFAICLIVHPIFLGTAKAQTLGDLRNELNQKQNEYNQNKANQALTEQEISNVNASIVSIQNQINQTYIDIDNLTIEIENLNKQIDEKEQEVKDIISFVQVSNGESAYLEYMFGAKDFTDFIYRVAVSEQLTAYNDKLIDEYNAMIETNKQKQVEIEEKRASLSTKQEELQKKKEQLGQKLNTIASTSISLEDEIKEAKEIIALYESKNCKDDEDIATCGKSLLPPGTSFYRPLESSYVTSEWGTRYYMGKTFHEGMDFGAREGTNVYSIATGMVASIFRKHSCGGNMVIVHHNINGTTYTSVYAHLLTINVSEGATVTKNTVIGTSGGQSTKSYDSCTGGAHLHMTVARGLYGIDYTSWSVMNYQKSINPRTVINFPSGTYNPWSDRVTAY